MSTFIALVRFTVMNTTNMKLKEITPPLLIVLVLCPAVTALAVLPAPDGGYPGLNTAEGENALFSLTTGVANTALGGYSLFTNTEGSYNTAVGAATLLNNLGDQNTGDGTRNTAVGAAALLNNRLGRSNTANGVFALLNNTDGSYNTAVGDSALANNSIAIANTAVGYSALLSNTGGNNNTANGYAALNNMVAGNDNTAVGSQALLANSSNSNTAIGSHALAANHDGYQNTATGDGALYNNISGVLNTATGYLALAGNTEGVANTADGYLALGNCTGSYNIGLGGGINITSGNFNIVIGNDGVNSDSGVIRIGSTCCQSQAFIAGIHGAVVSGGSTVYVKSDGQLGTSTSSIRFKDEIKPMDRASEAIFALKPVTFRYKKEVDPERLPQFGLVAEEVEKVNPGLVVSDPDGKPYTVRYEQINAMLLNEFLKEHQQVQEQRKEMEALRAELKEQRRLIQRVNAKIELARPAPKIVKNRQEEE